MRARAGFGSLGRELLRPVARAALWLAVAAVLARGASDLLSPGSSRTVAAVHAALAAPRWSDDAARAFAVTFASAYLTLSPGDPSAHARQLAAFTSPELADQLAPRLPRGPAGQAVRSATVEHVTSLDRRHALVTVAVTLGHDGALSNPLLTIPVARDVAGGLVVYDLPSFAAAPARATVTAPQGSALFGADQAAITDAVTRFLRAYLAADGGALTYLVAPGTRVNPVAGRFELVELASLAVDHTTTHDRRSVLATVQAREVDSRVTYALRYRLELVRRDRWYVAAINTSGKE